jgi:archaeal cell division control protein 6
MGHFDDVLGGDESLFVDSMPLDVDFMPPIVKHRENEQSYIADCLKPLFAKRSGKNLVIVGVPGIGKTVATKHILSELEKESGDIKTIFINCWKKDTAYKVAVELCTQAGFKFIANRHTEELITEAVKILNKNPCVIVLDEADKIEDQQIFYTIFEEIFTKSIICITNEKDWLSKLDGRVRSRMMAELLEFKAYGYEEVKDILKERVNYAFVQGVFDQEAFELVAQKTFDIGDVRAGLFLLKNSGEKAEGKSKRKITLEHAEHAVSKLDEFQRKSTSLLGEEEEFILKVVRGNSGITSKEMHERYQGSGGKLAYTTFQRKLKVLNKGKFVTLNEINLGKGRSTKVNYGGPEKKLYDFL